MLHIKYMNFNLSGYTKRERKPYEPKKPQYKKMTAKKAARINWTAKINIEQASKKVMQDYDKTFKDLAKYENEPTIETHTDNSFWKYAVPIFLVLGVMYFIIRSI